MPGAGISFANVSYSLPTGRVLLRDISLTLTPCTTTAILGRSGSGKTTLLRMVNGMVQPTSGAVLVGGQSTRDRDQLELRRGIGYVIQETGLFPHMTVERNAGLTPEHPVPPGRTQPHPPHADRRPQPRPRARPRRNARPRKTPPRRRSPRPHRSGLRRVPRPLPVANLRRPAPARRPGPRARGRSRRPDRKS